MSSDGCMCCLLRCGNRGALLPGTYLVVNQWSKYCGNGYMGDLVSFLVNNRYYDKQKSRNVRKMENDGLEMTISEKWRSEAVNNGQPLFNFENKGDEKTDR